MSTHRMVEERRTDQEILFVCQDGCGRRIVVGPAARLVVVDHGDFFAMHHASATPPGLALEVAVSG